MIKLILPNRLLKNSKSMRWELGNDFIDWADKNLAAYEYKFVQGRKVDRIFEIYDYRNSALHVSEEDALLVMMAHDGVSEYKEFSSEYKEFSLYNELLHRSS